MDIKKIAYELSAPFANVEAPQADNGSSKPPKTFTKTFFLLKDFIENYYTVIAIYLIEIYDYIYAHKTAKHIRKHVCVILTHSAAQGGSKSPRF